MSEPGAIPKTAAVLPTVIRTRRTFIHTGDAPSAPMMYCVHRTRGNTVLIAFTLVLAAYVIFPQQMSPTSGHGIVVEYSNPGRPTIGVAYNFYSSYRFASNDIWGWNRGVSVAVAPSSPALKDILFSCKPYVNIFIGRGGAFLGLKGVLTSDFRTNYSLRIAPEFGFSLSGYLMVYVAGHIPIPVFRTGREAIGEAGIHLYFPIESKKES